MGPPQQAAADAGRVAAPAHLLRLPGQQQALQAAHELPQLLLRQLGRQLERLPLGLTPCHAALLARPLPPRLAGRHLLLLLLLRLLLLRLLLFRLLLFRLLLGIAHHLVLAALRR